jgi:hypothetical protein
MASFQNTFRNERGITTSLSSSSSCSNSSSSRDLEFYYNDDDDSNSLYNIVYKFIWGYTPKPQILSPVYNNDIICDLRN